MLVEDRESSHFALPSAEINAVLERHFETEVLVCPRCDREGRHVALPSAEINAVLEDYFETEVLVCPRCGCGLSQRMEDGIATYCGCCGQLIGLGYVAS